MAGVKPSHRRAGCALVLGPSATNPSAGELCLPERRRVIAGQPGTTFTPAQLTREVWGHDPAAVGPSDTIDSTTTGYAESWNRPAAGS